MDSTLLCLPDRSDSVIYVARSARKPKNNKLKSDNCLHWLGVKTTCQKEREIKRLQPVVSMKIPSQFLRPSGPWWSTLRCDVNGGYRPVQCLVRTSFCWCVDKYGREIPRTRISGTPRCGPMGKKLS